MKRLMILMIFLSFPTSCFAQPGQDVVAGEPINLQASESAFFAQPTELVDNETLTGTVVDIKNQEIYEYTPGQNMVSAQLLVRIRSGSLKGNTVLVDYNRSLAQGEKLVAAGDKVLVNLSRDHTGLEVFYFIDYTRDTALTVLFLVFVALVLVVGGKHGVFSLLGLVSSFVVIFTIVLPGLQEGYSPVLVAIVGSMLIMSVTFYLSHGVNQKTHLAVVGTLIALICTGLLGEFFVGVARLTGFGLEEASFLQVIKGGQLNVRGLLLAGIIIGTLGVLDDITISQASIVKELKEANNKLHGRKLFLKAMNVGRDHIASLVNTLILVYAGSSLPLLMLFNLDPSRSFSTVLNYEMVAEEVVRTLVGSIGLVLAVPITTFLAVYFGFKKNSNNR